MKREISYRVRHTIIGAAATLLLGGCAFSQAPVLDPQGPVALAERDLLLSALAVMLVVVIPVFLMTFIFAVRYRATNSKARYMPDWSYSFTVDAVVWIVPVLIVVALGALLWNATHRLDPYKAIAADAEPITVEVVAQDWKWLFIYPNYGVAAVNELVFPSDTPVSLKITSDTVMNSFHIPALAGQIYAMAGMQTRLNFLADAPGRFMGRNTQYSGDGFPDQHFIATAETPDDFQAWLQQVRQSPQRLDAKAYEALAKPSIAHPVTYYSEIEPGLFGSILAKYAARPPNGHAGYE